MTEVLFKNFDKKPFKIVVKPYISNVFKYFNERQKTTFDILMFAALRRGNYSSAPDTMYKYPSESPGIMSEKNGINYENIHIYVYEHCLQDINDFS